MQETWDLLIFIFSPREEGPLNICINWAIVLLNGLIQRLLNIRPKAFSYELWVCDPKRRKIPSWGKKNQNWTSWDERRFSKKKIQQIRNNRHHLNPQLWKHVGDRDTLVWDQAGIHLFEIAILEVISWANGALPCGKAMSSTIRSGISRWSRLETQILSRVRM